MTYNSKATWDEFCNENIASFDGFSTYDGYYYNNMDYILPDTMILTLSCGAERMK